VVIDMDLDGYESFKEKNKDFILEEDPQNQKSHASLLMQARHDNRKQKLSKELEHNTNAGENH